MGKPVCPPCPVTKEQAVGDIIESVSMEQTALAHILNAESEKLLTVVNSPGVTPQQLMCVNQSVQGTIGAISRLEMLLQAKLELFRCTICR